VQPSQGQPRYTPPEAFDRLIGAAAEELVAMAARETHLSVDRLQGERKRTTFQQG
jgi:hypothetical protein